MLKKYILDIKEKTSDMNRKERVSYILTYYWYHILGGIAIIALILLFGTHYLFGNKKPVFTCIMVNQKMNTERDNKMTELFSKEYDLPEKQVVIDSGYQFSYNEMKLDGVNESSYEKFFFQWQNKEIDAVILSESFYRYCKELGGNFKEIREEELGDFEAYLDDGRCKAIVLGTDHFTEELNGEKEEKLLLAFPSTGTHEEERKAFLEFLKQVKEGKTGGLTYEEIIN